MKLLQPSEINAETGYRYYNIKQCAQLDMIQYMKALGMNLVQIKQCLDGKGYQGVQGYPRKAETKHRKNRSLKCILRNRRSSGL